MGLAKGTFMAYVAMKDSEPTSLEALLRESYTSSGWPEHYVSEDLGRLAKEHIDNIQIPAVSIDVLAAKLGLPVKLRFKISDSVKPVLASVIEKYRKSLEAFRIYEVAHVANISKKGWKKQDLPKGIKIRIEDAVDAKSDVLASLSAEFAKTTLTLPNRMTVSSADGKKYETDRYCPHKGVDLICASIEGSILTCPKHRWKFDLSRGGTCVEGKSPCTLNAVALDW
ncbi:hypothetical protein PSACC_01308 [Paramicrosporidium saccamoebae]|uniref:Rieske domain-containing protein n=1 Tax=Paramicrosporidium saccamoebae TaxID=1246581 RepID=A0A2H9TM70_9FUNG|nr:hypothetical protein PSACC_01308 [Paramicrosporidium saccamoebae]